MLCTSIIILFFFFFFHSFLFVCFVYELNDGSHLLLLPSYYLRLWFFFYNPPQSQFQSQSLHKLQFFYISYSVFFFSSFQNFSPSCLTIDNHKEIDNLLIIFFTTCNLLCRVFCLFFWYFFVWDFCWQYLVSI